MPTNNTYSFDEDYQLKIAALLLRDPSFVKEYSDVVSPSYFEFSYLSSIARVTLELVEKHNQIPTRETLVQKLKEFCATFRVSVEECQGVLDKVDLIYQVDLADSLIVKDSVIGFGKYQALKCGVLEVVNIIDKPDSYDKVRDVIDAALKVGYNSQELGLDFYKALTDVKSIISRVSDTGDNTRRVKSCIPILDDKTMGGPSRGEVWVILGFPGHGKSMWLLNMGVAALEQGLPVVHITIGDLKEDDVFLRYATRLTQCTFSEVLSMSPTFMRRIDKIRKYTERYLRIKFYPSNTITPQTIRAYLSKLYCTDGIQPGLTIVDYPDEFKPYCDDLYTNSGRQYSELGQIASEFNTLVWVASQVTRVDIKDPSLILRMSNVANSWQKAMKADGICSLNQNESEHARGVAELWVDKVRRGEKFFGVRLDTDYKGCSIIQAAEQCNREGTEGHSKKSKQ